MPKKYSGNFAGGPVLGPNAEQFQIDKAVRSWIRGEIDLKEGDEDMAKKGLKRGASKLRTFRDAERKNRVEEKRRGITIPTGSPFEDVERVIAGDPAVWNKYKKDKLTLADHVYDMAVQTKFGSKKIDIAATDKACLGHPEFIGTGLAPYYSALRNNIRRAEKIVLEDDFVQQVVQLSSPEENQVNPNYLRLMQGAISLARNPFSRTWFEWDCRAMLEERKKIGSVQEIMPDSPVRLGALCVSASDDGSIFHVEEFFQTHPDAGGGVSPSMFRFGLNTEGPMEIPRLRRQRNGVRLDLNSAYNRQTGLIGHMRGSIEWEPFKQITVDMNELVYTLMFDQTRMIDWEIDGDVKEAAGTMKFIAVALALINCAELQYNVASIPSGRRFSGGKTIPYMEHRTVKIKVPAGKKNVTKYLNSVLKTESARKRAHKVRGFWRTLERGTSSERKVWVKTHVRGDASLGWVNQDHIVTT